MSWSHANPHDDCWKLLPWHVTGRLSARDAQRVEHHLAQCESCRTELAEQQRVCESIRADEPSVVLAPQASLAKLMARIDASVPATLDACEPSLPDAQSPPPAQRKHSWLAIAAAIQAIAIAALLAVVWQQSRERLTAPRFTTLTQPAVVVAKGALVRVVFQPATNAEQLQALLRDVDAQIVAGPTEAGVYTLRVPDERTAETLRELRAHPAVVFAEHAEPAP